MTTPRHEALIVFSMLVIFGGLLIALFERLSHEELAKQYKRMALVFEAGLREFDACLKRGAFAEAQLLLEALGREAIAEHASWVILRRSRPLELHIGG
jgi:hypothetical protein